MIRALLGREAHNHGDVGGALGRGENAWLLAQLTAALFFN